ncbi:hypothetical protein ABXT08_18495 [Chryseobacterium sp. NRRL B-14859]|uniref:hypothetical protein n=1 Tax=Chryseobacterium sp. NRRL B-14859 TaxID=1562763 RepID=UPI0033953BDD
MRREVLQRFLTNTDETGRFLVKSSVTGITYFVEPLYQGKTAVWGDLNPATKQLEGDYGSKNTGAVKERDSLLKEENGFANIGYFKGSPFGEIDRRDKEHELRIKEIGMN